MDSRAPRTLVAGLLVALATLARTAHAAEPDLVSITWTAPSECPTEEKVRSQALRLLAGPPIRPDRRVFATAHVVHLATGPWRVELAMSSATAEGKRTVESSTCDGLADATALIIAIMVDPDRATAAAAAPGGSGPSATGPAVAPAPASAPPPAFAPAPPPTPAPAPTPFPRLRFSAGGWALLDTSMLPSAAYGVGLGGAVTVGHLRVDVAGGFFPDRTYSVSVDSSLGADMRLLSGSGGVAYVMSLAKPTSGVDLALGGGVEGTYIHAEAVPLKAPVAGRPGDAAWATLRAGATLTAPIYRPVFAHVEVLGLAPLERPPFVINPKGTVFLPGVVSLRLGVGAEVHF